MLRSLLPLLLLPCLAVPAQVPAAALDAQSQAESARRPISPTARYKLRAGDIVTLDYRYTPEFNQTATIQPDGYVDLPVVGAAHLAGLSLDEAGALVRQRASRTLKDPVVNVSLKQFERPFFVVAGEVDHPGRFDFYEKTTALQGILEAGGFRSTAQQSDVYLFRRVDGALVEVHRLNLKKIRSAGDLERDLVLEPGDMILVPRNRLENISRFIKATNLNLYFDPLTYALR